MNHIKILLILPLIALVAMACTRIPDRYQTIKETLTIYPDYRDVVVPANIAPMNFMIDEEAVDYCTVVTPTHGKALVIPGRKVCFSTSEWNKIRSENKGGKIVVSSYLKRNETWYRYPDFSMQFAEDETDPYVVYRLIQPLYTTYEEITINQRNLSNFDTKVVYDNRLVSTEKEGQCVNCHSFQDYNRNGSMQMHFRGKTGGTVIVNKGTGIRVNLKAKDLISGGVYPAWHPSANLIAYSVNDIGQDFHTKDLQKVEVMDTRSDLVLYDVSNNTLYPVSMEKDYLETFPSWSPDGRFLYYSTAKYIPESEDIDTDISQRYAEIRYNLVRRAFDSVHKTFGPEELVFDAERIRKSAVLPRISPDGSTLLFSMADYGNFHIWHKSSNLYALNLRTNRCDSLPILNSPETESYHSWSSNGRWILFSSRRDDGTYTRLYLSWFDKKGQVHKPFALPQKNPELYKELFKSYNIPEFVVKPVQTTAHQFANLIRSKEIKAQFNPSK